MTVARQCECGHRIYVRDVDIGKSVPCPNCQRLVRVEKAGEGEEEGLSYELRPVPSDEAGSGLRGCPKCARPMAVTSVICLNCGYDARTGRKLHSVSRSTPARNAPAGGSGKQGNSSRNLLIALVVICGLGGIAAFCYLTSPNWKHWLQAVQSGKEPAQSAWRTDYDAFLAEITSKEDEDRALFGAIAFGEMVEWTATFKGRARTLLAFDLASLPSPFVLVCQCELKEIPVWKTVKTGSQVRFRGTVKGPGSAYRIRSSGGETTKVMFVVSQVTLVQEPGTAKKRPQLNAVDVAAVKVIEESELAWKNPDAIPKSDNVYPYLHVLTCDPTLMPKSGCDAVIILEECGPGFNRQHYKIRTGAARLIAKMGSKAQVIKDEIPMLVEVAFKAGQTDLINGIAEVLNVVDAEVGAREGMAYLVKLEVPQSGKYRSSEISFMTRDFFQLLAPHSSAPIASVLADKDSLHGSTREFLLEMLGEFGISSECVPYLRKMIESSDESDLFRGKVALALGELYHRDPVDEATARELVHLLTDIVQSDSVRGDNKVRFVQALGMFGPAARESLPALDKIRFSRGRAKGLDLSDAVKEAQKRIIGE